MRIIEHDKIYEVVEIGHDYTGYVRYKCYDFIYTANLKDLSKYFIKQLDYEPTNSK